MAFSYLMITLDCDAALSLTSQLSTAIGSSPCPSGRLTERAGSSLLPCLRSITGGACLLIADAAAGNMHRSNSSMASEWCDCSASESGGGGSTPYMGGCKAAAA